jgi:type 1 fimbria pilin
MLLNRKIYLTALSIVSMASISTAVSAATETQSFSATGNIVSRNCSISIPNPTIIFDDIKVADITPSSVAPNAKNQEFINMSLSCPSNTHVAVSVLGEADQNDPNALAIESSTVGSAKNVAVAFWDSDANYTLMPLNSGNSASINVPAGNVPVSYMVRSALVQANTSESVTAGTVSASAQIKIVYL